MNQRSTAEPGSRDPAGPESWDDRAVPSGSPVVVPGPSPALSSPRDEDLGDAASKWGARLGVLRHRAFRRVWFAAMGSSVGTWMEGVGVQWLMALQTGSTFMMGLLAMAQLGPTLLLGLLGGLLADRVDRKKMLLVTQAMMMTVAATLTFVALTDRATANVLLLLGLAQGVAIAFNVPAWATLTPRLVPRVDLTKAIALNSMQFNVARVVGPALAGILMGLYGPAVLFAVNTVSFLGVIAAVATTAPAPPAPGNGASALRRIAEAASFTFRRKGPLAIFAALVLFASLAAPLQRMLPLFVSEVYRASERTYGVMLGLMGVGAVAGGLLLKLVPPWYPKHHFIPLSLTGGGLSIALFTLADNEFAGGAVLLLVGLFWLWSFSSCWAGIQLLVPDEMRGRVMSIFTTAAFGAMPLGSITAGVIGERFGPQMAVASLAIVLVLAGLVMLVYRTPEVDGLEPGDPGYERRPGLLRGLTASIHKPRTESE